MQPYTLVTEPEQTSAAIFQHLFFCLPQPQEELARVTGLPYASVQDDILEALRANRHKPTILARNTPIELNETSGIRLALLFKTIAPLTAPNTIQGVRWRIAAMSNEIVYYWFAQCYGEYAVRATLAFRIFLGADAI